MEETLRAVLGRTLTAKTFWLWVNGKPTNLGAALDMLGPADLNTLVQLHRRLTTAGLWGNITTIKTVWTPSSLGITYNGTSMQSVLDNPDRNDFCKDTTVARPTTAATAGARSFLEAPPASFLHA